MGDKVFIQQKAAKIFLGCWEVVLLINIIDTYFILDGVIIILIKLSLFEFQIDP